MKKRGVIRLIGCAVLLSVAWCNVPAVLAENATSSHYEASEFHFSAGAESKTCSGSYCASVSIGDASDQPSPAPSSASFGTVPRESEPLLEVIVDPGVSNLGELSTSKTATKTMTVRVRTQLSSGYTLQINGAPPAYGAHSLHTLVAPTTSAPGTEQFGLNAVANTTPKVGANPVRVPSNQANLGVIESDYRTANQFRYSSGSTIASSTADSGQVDYTISMIVNISGATPAGHYSSDFSAVVVPRF